MGIRRATKLSTWFYLVYLVLPGLFTKRSLPAEQVGSKPGLRDSEVGQYRWQHVGNAIMSALTTLHAR